MSRPAVISLALLTAANAWAFRPAEDVHIGIEPQRILRTDVHSQLDLTSASVWAKFTRGEGAGWMARFDQKTGTPHRMWGAGIDIGAVSTQAEVEDGLRAFLARHPGLTGASTRELSTASVNYVERVDTWYVDFDVLRGGAPVYRGGVTARIKHGKLIMVGVDTYPHTPVTGSVMLDADDALAIAAADGPAPQAMHGDAEAGLIALPIETDDGLVLRKVWQTRTRTDSPVGIWVSFIDAETGELLNVHNEVRYLQQGTINAQHHERRPDGDMTVSAVPWGLVTDGNSNSYADELGNWEHDSDDALSTELRGSWLRVQNSAGPEGWMDAGTDATWTDAEATQAEIDSYVFLHHIRQWAADVTPELGISRDDLKSMVNLNETCNAYYDGNVNFFQSGSGCRNTGQSADVNYHEFGHGFHYYSMEAGVWDGSIGEGAADVVAFLQTHDHIIAPGFMSSGDGIRRVDRNRSYPDDYRASEDFVHSNGVIFGGAMWDLWDILEDDFGQEAGEQIVTDIFTGLLKGGPTIESSYDEAIVADDDDGDLSNGTPHQCQIIEAFGQHGLGPTGQGSPLVAHHVPLEFVSANIDAGITVDLYNMAPTCFDLSARAAIVTFRVNGGDWQESSLIVAGTSAVGVIPQQSLGDFVEYFVTVEDENGGEMSAPEGADINPFNFYVGDVLQVHCDDFETDDGAFTHALIAGQDIEGADDWQWGTPSGQGGDPGEAYSGSKVWGNDLGNDEYNGEYQNDRHNQLSAVLPSYHYEGSFLNYYRWLTIEDGFFDQATISADGVEVWTNHATGENQGEEHHIDRQWVPHSVDLGGAADQGSVEITWDLISDQGLSMGGWTIDNVCLLAPNTPDNRLGVSDFRATPNGADGQTATRLTWTNPKHDPLSELIVVRRSDRMPTGPDDGKLIMHVTDPELGDDMVVLDVSAKANRAYYYAVYTSDGETWLSWTRDGFNADIGGSSAEAEVGGCGCSTTPDPVLGWLGLGLIGLLVRRRND